MSQLIADKEIEKKLRQELPPCHTSGDMLLRVYTCQNATLQEITCCGSYLMKRLKKMLCLSNSQQIIVHLCKSNIIFPFSTILTLSFTTAWFCNLFSSALSSAWSSTIRKITFYFLSLARAHPGSCASWFDFLRPSLQFFSHVWMGLLGLNQY